MRTVKFDEDFTFNVTGGADGRLSKEAGDVFSCNDVLADRLVNHWGVASFHDMQPQETKSVKVDFSDLPESEKLAGAGFESIGEVSNAGDEELLDIKGIGDKTLEDIRGFFE